MQRAGRSIGRWLNQLISSDGWKAFQRTSREIRNLPTNLMRQANLDELKETGRDIQNAIDPNWDRRRPAASPPARPSEPAAPPQEAPRRDPADAPDDAEPDA
jgi:hypothetical protein